MIQFSFTVNLYNLGGECLATVKANRLTTVGFLVHKVKEFYTARQEIPPHEDLITLVIGSLAQHVNGTQHAAKKLFEIADVDELKEPLNIIVHRAEGNPEKYFG